MTAGAAMAAGSNSGFLAAPVRGQAATGPLASQLLARPAAVHLGYGERGRPQVETALDHQRQVGGVAGARLLSRGRCRRW
jgi:hypothetical protein